MFLQTRLDKVLSNDLLRESFNCVYFKHRFAYATDGHVAVRQCLSKVHLFSGNEIEILEGKMIHKKKL